jgi:predicted nucleic acid-binding protein
MRKGGNEMDLGIVMVDTSVWIEYFRSGEGEVSEMIDSLIAEDRAAICGVVEMELLHGVKKTERGELEELFSALNYLELSRQDFRMAGELLNAIRSSGSLIPATDALIGSACMKEGIPLLTADKHFEKITGLKLVKLQARQ